MIRLKVRKQMKTSHGPETLEIDCTIHQGQLTGLVGPSGAGKTTFLKMLSGLIDPDEGHIEANGQVWFDGKKRFSLAPQQRKIGFVFQEPTLFPHMTVRQNLEFSVRTSGHAKEIIDQWVSSMGLGQLQQQRPHQLSAGQKQKVALVRALASSPKLLLLDEPLSALDLEERLRLQDEIIAVYKRTQITSILVSHDACEVFKLSDRMIVLEKGRIIRSGSPQEVLIDDRLSGKFKFPALVMDILKDGVIYIVTLSVGANIVKVVASEEEAQGLIKGSRVIVASKAFNPVILKY